MDFSIEMIRSVYEGRRPEAIGKHRYFSVLVPFVERDGELCLLYEVRAESVSQPGEVCFPGGHVEKGEHPCDCALRETYEEIGVPADRVRLIGPGDRLYGYANFTLFTYLGVVDYEDYKKAKLAEDEVSEIFLMPLKNIEETKPEIYVEKITTNIDKGFPYERLGISEDYGWRVGTWEIPVYDFGNRVIWGMTARITASIIDNVKGKNAL